MQILNNFRQDTRVPKSVLNLTSFFFNLINCGDESGSANIIKRNGNNIEVVPQKQGNRWTCADKIKHYGLM